MKFNKKKKIKIIAIIIASLIIVLLGGFYIYTLDYYRADSFAIQTFSENPSSFQNEGEITVFYPDKQLDGDTGLINKTLADSTNMQIGIL